jgi:hypothetical protein
VFAVAAQTESVVPEVGFIVISPGERDKDHFSPVIDFPIRGVMLTRGRRGLT